MCICVYAAAVEFVQALDSLELLWFLAKSGMYILKVCFKILKEKATILLIGHHNARVVFIKEQ